MSFKSQREIFEYLLKGGKIRHSEWTDDNFFLFLDFEGKIATSNGKAYELFLKYPQDWQPYTEPKQKKKVTLYRYTFKASDETYFQSHWTQSPVHGGSSSKGVLVEQKEIEVDE